MNRALWKPSLVIITLLVLTAAGGLLLRGASGSAQQPSGAPADETPNLADNPKPASSPGTDEPSKGTDTPKAPKADEAAKATQARERSEDRKTDPERRQLLETIGALTAAHCYQTYFNLGLLADGKAKGVYTNKDAARVLESIVSLQNSVDQKLAALGKIDLDKVDRATLDQMRDLSALLRQQARELQSFWDTGKDEDAARYESVRKDAWAAICKLMGSGR
jgi:hypothetical protein